VDLQALGEQVGGGLVVRGSTTGNTDRAVRATASWPFTSRRIISVASGRSSSSVIDDSAANSR
jgi:hypothetical protein